MTTKTIVVDNFFFQELKKLKNYAEKNIITHDDLIKISKGEAKIIGDRKEHCFFFADTYKIVYSMENIPHVNLKKIYPVKRLSVSINNGKYPSIEFVKLIMCELEMKDLEDCRVKLNENDIIPNIEIIDFL